MSSEYLVLTYSGPGTSGLSIIDLDNAVEELGLKISDLTRSGIWVQDRRGFTKEMEDKVIKHLSKTFPKVTFKKKVSESGLPPSRNYIMENTRIRQLAGLPLVKDAKLLNEASRTFDAVVELDDLLGLDIKGKGSKNSFSLDLTKSDLKDLMDGKKVSTTARYTIR